MGSITIQGLWGMFPKKSFAVKPSGFLASYQNTTMSLQTCAVSFLSLAGYKSLKIRLDLGLYEIFGGHL